MARRLTLWLALLLIWPMTAAAQVDYHPTPAPLVSAAGRSWYRADDPIPFAGGLYDPAGPFVYFDGYRMVPTGMYDGIPLYADTTRQPYSEILVPCGGKLMRPYERRRTGESAGMAGTGPPPFPVEPGQPPARTSAAAPVPVPTTGERWLPVERAAPVLGPGAHLESVRKPVDNRGIWISWDGCRWEATGEAITLAGSGLMAVGGYEGHAVFARSMKDPQTIYLWARDDLVTPYRRVR